MVAYLQGDYDTSQMCSPSAASEGRYLDAEVDARHVVDGTHGDPVVMDYARSVLQQALNASR